MILGYILTGSDNDSFMLDDADISTQRCPTCKYLSDFSYHNPFFKLKRKAYDYSHPYDIGSIVSLRFKEFCIREKYSATSFKEFEREPNFFQLVVTAIVQFDSAKSKTRLTGYCETCQNYEEAIMAFSYLKNDSTPLKDGFYRTDMVFGSKDCKNPLVIVGVETYQKLKREKMKGLYFEAINAE